MILLANIDPGSSYICSDLKKTDTYFSSKDGFTGYQQWIAIQGLKPQQARCKYLQDKGRETLLKRQKKVRRTVVNRVCGFSFAEYLPRNKSFLLPVDSAIVPGCGKALFLLPTIFCWNFCLLISHVNFFSLYTWNSQ